MLRQGFRVMLAAVVLVVPVGAAPAALADPAPGGGVDCDQFPDHPECTVNAEVVSPGGAGDPDGTLECTLEGEVVPCVTQDGWLGSDGCRYLRQPEAEPPTGARQPGAAYRPTCRDDPPGAQRALVWIPDSQTLVAALAEVAVSRLRLPRPPVTLSPAPPAAQLVRLPTWLWIAPGWWVPRSASAAVPGLSVTAVAAPVRVRWDTGDGAVVACDGPGTPYPAAGNPAAASPDCGHTYTRSSAARPGGVYGLAATVSWQVAWSGGGLSGSLGPLFSTAQVEVAVSEVQAVIVP
jgi:hypothetical protein